MKRKLHVSDEQSLHLKELRRCMAKTGGIDKMFPITHYATCGGTCFYACDGTCWVSCRGSCIGCTGCSNSCHSVGKLM